MEIDSNFEKYSPSRKSNLDQLVCLLKGGLEMIMINKTFSDNVKYFYPFNYSSVHYKT